MVSEDCQANSEQLHGEKGKQQGSVVSCAKTKFGGKSSAWVNTEICTTEINYRVAELTEY